MGFESLFKFLDFNVFLTSLFFQAYRNYFPIITIKKGQWEFFAPRKRLEQIAKEGFELALKDGYFEEFDRKTAAEGKKLKDLMGKKIAEMDERQFLAFFENFCATAGSFTDCYKMTEFPYFVKIEKELEEFSKSRKMEFQAILSRNTELKKWPEKKRKLAIFESKMQHLKFEMRKIINETIMGKEAVAIRLMEEITRRTKRTDISEGTIEEIKLLLKNKTVKDFSERQTYSVIRWKRNKMVIITGNNAFEKIKELERVTPKKEVFGMPAQHGIAKGKATILLFSKNPGKQLQKMKKGNILIADTTGPEMVVAIKKAIAIVTDEGGMMSHAAVISREFGIPCVVGTKLATKAFKDNDIIEVNAYNGAVRKIK